MKNLYFAPRFAIVYAFLFVLAFMSAEHIWQLQTNPMMEYLGSGGLRFFLGLAILGVSASLGVAYAIHKRKKSGPVLIVLIAVVLLLFYTGSKIGIYFMSIALTPAQTSTSSMFGAFFTLQAVTVSLLALAALIVSCSKGFRNEYTNKR